MNVNTVTYSTNYLLYADKEDYTSTLLNMYINHLQIVQYRVKICYHRKIIRFIYNIFRQYSTKHGLK